MHRAGQVPGRGADDQLVELAVGDRAMHRVQGIVPCKLATSRPAARRSGSGDVLAPFVVISVLGRIAR